MKRRVGDSQPELRERLIAHLEEMERLYGDLGEGFSSPWPRKIACLRAREPVDFYGWELRSRGAPVSVHGWYRLHGDDTIEEISRDDL